MLLFFSGDMFSVCVMVEGLNYLAFISQSINQYYRYIFFFFASHFNWISVVNDYGKRTFVCLCFHFHSINYFFCRILWCKMLTFLLIAWRHKY